MNKKTLILLATLTTLVCFQNSTFAQESNPEVLPQNLPPNLTPSESNLVIPPLSATKPDEKTPPPVLNINNKDKIFFNAISMEYNIGFGIYSYAWNITLEKYQVNTKVVATGMAKMFVDYFFEEASSGEVVENKLKWKNFRYSKIFDNKAEEPIIRNARLITNGKVQLQNEQVKAEHQPFDIPSLILNLMLEEQKLGKSLTFDILNHNILLPITMKLEKIEKVNVSAGEFNANVWFGKNPKFELKVWLDTITNKPVKFYFKLSGSSGLLLEALKGTSLN